MKVKVGDNVLVLAGKDRLKTGKILRLDSKHNKVVVDKVAIKTKHVKKRQGQAGQILHFEAYIAVSNVAVICPACKKKTRVSYIRLENGKKQRVCKKCKQSLDLPEQIKRAKK